MTFGEDVLGPAEHVLAEGHWGQSLREYMRDYNHWTVLGVLAEFLPQPENRVMLSDEVDANDVPVAHFNYSQCENDKALTPRSRSTSSREIWDGRVRRTR